MHARALAAVGLGLLALVPASAQETTWRSATSSARAPVVRLGRPTALAARMNGFGDAAELAAASGALSVFCRACRRAHWPG